MDRDLQNTEWMDDVLDAFEKVHGKMEINYIDEDHIEITNNFVENFDSSSVEIKVYYGEKKKYYNGYLNYIKKLIIKRHYNKEGKSWFNKQGLHYRILYDSTDLKAYIIYKGNQRWRGNIIMILPQYPNLIPIKHNNEIWSYNTTSRTGLTKREDIDTDYDHHRALVNIKIKKNAIKRTRITNV